LLFSIFLHIYQPEDQVDEVLDRIVNESYRPIFRFLIANSNAKLTFNINAVLTELWDKKGYSDLIDNVRVLLERGQIELTESAKYHAFLPLIPKSEILRQIRLNHETNKFYFGPKYQPQGFFSPEMSYSAKITSVVGELGYKYILADEIAYNGKLDQAKFDAIYKIKGTDIDIYLRHKNLSNLIMGANVRSIAEIVPVIKKYSHRPKGDSPNYILAAMDGETFGHHRPGLENLLFDLLLSPDLQIKQIEHIGQIIHRVEEIMPVDCTWASSEKQIAEGTPFSLWFDPDNTIHALQWELTQLAISVVQNTTNLTNEEKMGYYPDVVVPPIEATARKLLDSALHSCHYWWASAKPWWSLEMIEQGAYKLWQVVETSNGSTVKDKEQALALYQRILATAFSWQRTGFVRKLAKYEGSWRKIPFKDRGKQGEYQALLDLLKKQEDISSKKGEYEQAIRWRDAQYKLKNNLDVYDAVHIIDQLRSFVDFREFDDLVKKYAGYKSISPGQPEK